MDVNQIFRDLGTMVHEQGDMIDSIEANVENAQVHVSQAGVELSRARQYQVSIRYSKSSSRLHSYLNLSDILH